MKGLLRFIGPLTAMAVCGVIALMADRTVADEPARDKPAERAERKNVREQLDQILELKKEIDAAMKASDPQKTLELVTKLQKLMLAERGAPNVRLQFPRGGDRTQPKSDIRELYEKQLKEFADSIEKLKDDKEGREGIEKARDEYKKAMEAELKKADLDRPAPRARPDVPRVARLDPFKPLFDFGAFDLGINAAQPRLGVHLSAPTAILVEQLGLPADGGLVVVEVKNGSYVIE